MKVNEMTYFNRLVPLSAPLLLALSQASCSSDDEETMQSATGGMDNQVATGGTNTGGTSTGGSLASSGGMTSDMETGGMAGEESGSGGMAGGATGEETGGAGGTGGATEPECKTIVELAGETESLSILLDAVTKAGLADALGGEDLTVFAPTNGAFGALLETLGLSSLDDLSAEQLAPILTYHVADQVVDSAAALELAGDPGSAPTLGGTIKLELDGETLVLDADEFSANVIEADLEACNGVVHLIDGVLVPSIADIVTSQPSFSGLATLIGLADSGEAIGAALDGPASAVNDALDPGGFTLFAPENAAVEAVDPVPSGELLDDILQYHVLAGDAAVDAATATTLEMAMVEMLNGDEVTVNGDMNGAVELVDSGENSLAVVVTDLYAANGLIHVIDGVLLPTSVTNP